MTADEHLVLLATEFGPCTCAEECGEDDSGDCALCQVLPPDWYCPLVGDYPAQVRAAVRTEPDARG